MHREFTVKRVFDDSIVTYRIQEEDHEEECHGLHTITHTTIEVVKVLDANGRETMNYNESELIENFQWN